MLEVEFMTDLLWFFWIYSFGGYLVERAFAAATQAERRERKYFKPNHAAECVGT